MSSMTTEEIESALKTLLERVKSLEEEIKTLKQKMAKMIDQP